MQVPYDSRQASEQPYLAEPLKLTGTAGADGVCTVTSNPVPAGFRWLLDYLVCVARTAAAPAFSCYRDAADLFALIDGTTGGASAVGYYSPPRVVGQGLVVVGIWTGCNPGDKCQLTVEYRQEAVS